MGLILFFALFSSVAFAGDPLINDKRFLYSDPDKDYVETWEELTVGTDPNNLDSDNDGLPDYWELEYSKWRNPKTNALMDPTDASDAHLDFDYDLSSDVQGMILVNELLNFLLFGS